MKSKASEAALAPGARQQTVKVWDPFVRVFHWSLVAAFFGAYLLGEDGGLLHQSFGYVAVGLVAARVLWGLLGSKHARFADFVPAPAAFLKYVREVATGRERRYLGHNPAGGAMIVALILAVLATGLTGWLMTTPAFMGSELVEGVHEFFANSTLFLVGLHVCGSRGARYGIAKTW